MRLLESVIIMSESGPEILPEGTILEETGTIDVDLDKIQTEPQYSTAELSDMVERWLVKNKKYVEEGKITPNQWDFITGELLTLMKLLSRGDKEGIVDHLKAIKSQPASSDKQAKLKAIILKIYDNIASKLGTYEVHGNKILNKESVALSSIIQEGLESIEKAIV